MSESDGAAGVGRAAVKVRTPHKDVGKNRAPAPQGVVHDFKPRAPVAAFTPPLPKQLYCFGPITDDDEAHVLTHFRADATEGDIFHEKYSMSHTQNRSVLEW